ncbi:MAG TPA: hypothetical protein VGK24_09125 [Candidatus Angelobacter sp.]|jgi:hypothetical protein
MESSRFSDKIHSNDTFALISLMGVADCRFFHHSVGLFFSALGIYASSGNITEEGPPPGTRY